ncbi:MAG: hypothetical protein R6W91_03750 [Thermoplasmata archaeon]
MGPLSENGGMQPRKLILAMFITGIIIVASVGGVFISADYVGLIKADVSVSGYIQNSNATSCSLFVDGIKESTKSLGGDYYSYNNQYYNFYDVEVEANQEHEFKVVTSEGEESETMTEYTSFGQRSHVSINIIRKIVSVTVRGSYQGTNYSQILYCYADDETVGTKQINYPGQTTYSFTARVYEKATHIFRLAIQSSPYGGVVATNQTAVYVGSSSMTIEMNVG